MSLLICWIKFQVALLKVELFQKSFCHTLADMVVESNFKFLSPFLSSYNSLLGAIASVKLELTTEYPNQTQTSNVEIMHSYIYLLDEECTVHSKLADGRVFCSSASNSLLIITRYRNWSNDYSMPQKGSRGRQMLKICFDRD